MIIGPCVVVTGGPEPAVLEDAGVRVIGAHIAQVAGEVPNPLSPPPGCAFHPRCPHANDRCRAERPNLIWRGEAASACHGVEENRI